jgi:hypothetical protein
MIAGAFAANWNCTVRWIRRLNIWFMVLFFVNRAGPLREAGWSQVGER